MVPLQAIVLQIKRWKGRLPDPGADRGHAAPPCRRLGPGGKQGAGSRPQLPRHGDAPAADSAGRRLSGGVS
ncbi:hypothetical protein TPAR_02546 [Tolypocladium paradoxum]|uniref:Uncharacterized protein n=1 Tax=Tolypocladium paradoxum TaxID=94208 RepID=A0A2S4L486_9HYPO|nr:hypothetical protein TPAR_02546 [Tolypocladium paradoxum]